MEIFQQLGELFLQAVPTVLIVFLFFLFLRTSFFRPLDRVLAERRTRTEGARRATEASLTAAAEKTQAHLQALKKARAEIYAVQETARRAALEERAALVRAARNRATEEIRVAKERIAADLAGARRDLDKSSEVLGEELVRAILTPRPAGFPDRSEAR